MRLPWKRKSRSPGEENRRTIVVLSLQLIFVFMSLAVIVYVLVSSLLGSSLFVPRSAEEVLRSAQTPDRYQWISESARRVLLPGDYSEEQFAYRSAAINKTKDIFIVNTYGVLPTPALYLSDRRATVRIAREETAVAGDIRDGTLVTDACAAEGSPATPQKSDDGPIPARTLEMPSAEEILASNPRLLDDKATFQGKRSWLLEFDPAPETIEQLLWRPFLRKATQGEEFRTERQWVETPEEREALQNKDYKVLWAYAWVTRGERELAQLRIRLRLNLPGEKKIDYHLLGHLFSSEELTQIERESIGGEFNCDEES